MVDFQKKTHYAYSDLLSIMEILRRPEGCPWDKVQTHESIRRNFLEETYEAIDAIDRDSAPDMCEELGDVLMQVLFHAQIEAERGRFTMDDVVDGLAKKLVFRHPHVFGSEDAADPEAALANWDARKRQEKHHAHTSDAIEAVPHTLPALWRSEKILKKAAKAGFHWDSPLSALGKTEEELSEFKAALLEGKTGEEAHGAREELGDLLFAAAAVAQMLGIDPEDALHRACDKYQRRYRRAEALAGDSFEGRSIEDLVLIWEQAKQETAPLDKE